MEAEVYKSQRHPDGQSTVSVWQEYATGAYLTLFFVLAVVIYSRLVSGGEVWMIGIPGIFLIIFLSNTYAWIRMRMTFVEAGFTGDRFYLRNVYDVIKEKPPLMFPLMYANAKREGNLLWVHYYGRALQIDLREWESPSELLRHFSRLSPVK